VKTFAERIINFNSELNFKGKFPEGIRIMNPFRDNQIALECSSAFYNKYYNDTAPRHLIFGINPGRFGSGMTGVAFTDPKRITSKCNIPYNGPVTHEPSSQFIYEMIHAYGSIADFYSKFYIHSLCPLGFTIAGPKGKEVNYNYYDQPDLQKAAYPFIIDNLQKQIAIGFETDICYCFGTGKNESFFRKVNAEMGFFKSIIALEHPRYIMQYKAKTKQLYIDKYIKAFNLINE
jgi:hypothetical protein